PGQVPGRVEGAQEERLVPRQHLEPDGRHRSPRRRAAGEGSGELQLQLHSVREGRDREPRRVGDDEGRAEGQLRARRRRGDLPVTRRMTAAVRARVADERGAVWAFVALALPVILLFAAFGIDVGHWYDYKRTLQARADAAALAGGDAYGKTCFSSTPSA